MNTQGTSKIMRDAAAEMDHKANELRRMADELDRTGDWSIAGEAIACCTCFANIRLDLLAIRPARELLRELEGRKE